MRSKVKIENIEGIIDYFPKNKILPPGIIMVHGFGGKAFEEEFEDVAENLSKEGYYVLRFLFSGYKEGCLSSLTLSREIQELKSVIDFLENQKIDKNKIGIIAQSFGCVVSILLNDPRIKAMVLLAPSIDFESVFKRILGDERIKKLENQKKVFLKSGRRELGPDFWTSIRKLKRIKKAQIESMKCPLLMIHGLDDKTVPYQEAEKLFRWAKAPKELKLLKNTEHVVISEDKRRKKVIGYIKGFFSSYLK